MAMLTYFTKHVTDNSILTYSEVKELLIHCYDNQLIPPNITLQQRNLQKGEKIRIFRKNDFS